MADDDLTYRERIWRRLVAQRPDLEHLVLDIPERRPRCIYCLYGWLLCDGEPPCRGRRDG